MEWANEIRSIKVRFSTFRNYVVQSYDPEIQNRITINIELLDYLINILTDHFPKPINTD